MHRIKSLSRENKLYLCFALAALLPYLLYGFRYFPILDDYIQYWCYPAHEDLSHIYLTIGTLSTRPLAHLLDPAFWGQLWPVMGVALFLVTAMHILSALLFFKTLKRFDAEPSPLFLLIYLLLPLGMEGRYWLSASTRIVVGLFFAAVSLWFLGRFLKQRQSPVYFLPFALFQLISCGFYESAAIFSVTAACLLFLVSFYQSRKKSLLLVPVTSVVNIGLMFVYYRIFANLGLQGSRASSLNLGALPGKLIELLRQLGEVFSLFYAAIVKGSMEGLLVLFKNGPLGVLLFLLALSLCLVLCRFVRKDCRPDRTKALCFVCAGVILFFAPLVPNAMAADVWITNRSMFVSILGLALVAEPLFELIPKRLVRQVIFFALAFMFITATVNEYDVYRRTNELDGKLLDEVIAQLDEDSLAGRKNIRVVLPEEVLVEQNAFYKDHVKSVFDSDWALIGGLRTRMGNLNVQYAQPILPGQEIKTENSQIVMIEKLPE